MLCNYVHGSQEAWDTFGRHIIVFFLMIITGGRNNHNIYVHECHYLFRDTMTGAVWLRVDIGSRCGQKQTDCRYAALK